MESDPRNPKRPITNGDDTNLNTKTSRPKLTRDRLSELPDLAIVHIFSHLHTEEAARTSVLSKRFNSLWNSVPSLTFSNSNSGKNDAAFVSLVNSALGFHRRRFIDKFSLKFNYYSINKNSVDNWLLFVSEKQTKSIHLDFNGNLRGTLQFGDFTYLMPETLYRNVNLVELVTCFCDFPLTGKISCSRLKLLSMTHSILSAELISGILGGCSVLETLELRDCSGFDKLMIDSSNLRVLRIVGELSMKHPIQNGFDRALEISGPNLVSLEVSGMLYRTKLRLTDLGSLVCAVMAFTIMPRVTRSRSKMLGYYARDEEIAREVLESLCLVKVVTVGGTIIQALSTRGEYNLSSPWSERRSLTLRIPLGEWSHLAIASLLHSSPCLESLIIRPSYCSDTCVIQHANSSHGNAAHGKYYWKSWSTISQCPLLHLKTIKVAGFQVSCQSMTPLFQFLEFLLSNSKVLEEIVIQASRYVTRGALDEAMKLLSVQTASPDVVVQFQPPHLWVDPLCMYHENVPLRLDLE